MEDTKMNGPRLCAFVGWLASAAAWSHRDGRGVLYDCLNVGKPSTSTLSKDAVLLLVRPECIAKSESERTLVRSRAGSDGGDMGGDIDIAYTTSNAPRLEGSRTVGPERPLPCKQRASGSNQPATEERLK